MPRDIMLEHIQAAGEMLAERPEFVNHVEISMDEMRFEVRIPTRLVERHLQTRHRTDELPRGMPEIQISEQARRGATLRLMGQCGNWCIEHQIDESELARSRDAGGMMANAREEIRRRFINDWHNNPQAREAMEQGNHPSTFEQMRAFAERRPFALEYQAQPIRNRVEPRPSLQQFPHDWGRSIPPDLAAVVLTDGAGNELDRVELAEGEIDRVGSVTVNEEGAIPMSKLEREEFESRSVMVVDATARDLRTLNMFIQENDLEDDLMTQYFRLKGDKFVMILNSLLSVQSWKSDIKPKIVEMFGKARCRFETVELEEEYTKLKGGDGQ